MTRLDFDQTELPGEAPSILQLRKLRALLPLADGIIREAKGSEVWKDGTVATWEAKAIRRRQLALDKRLGALGVPLRAVAGAADFPKGTEDVAGASPAFFSALESAMSAIVAVNQAERALAPRP